mmetsp:Transcript_58149/g.161033  ORF Transcript_58149/g.161033 Transcript_58149/m.161033 type:complete len:547 (+) Transcript_58149:696-2336(+)
MLGEDFMLPWGPGWTLSVIWLAATIGGAAMKAIGMPSLLGNLIAGIILKNSIDNADINFKSVRGLPDSWASDIITFGLVTIFLRGGLEIDLDLVKKAGKVAAKLTFFPGCSEALAVAIFSRWIFGMENFGLGLSMGFILAAVSPAVVVGAMFDLKQAGYGVKQNIPVIVVAAASFDDVVAISGFAMAISFAIDAGHSETDTKLVEGFHGPLTIIVGLILGIMCSYFNAQTRIWNTVWKVTCIDKNTTQRHHMLTALNLPHHHLNATQLLPARSQRTAVVLFLGVFLAFGAKYLEHNWTVAHAHPIGASTGILAALIMAGCTAYHWEHGTGAISICGHNMATEEHDHKAAHQVEHNLHILWDLISQPLLFGVVGSYLDFRLISVETFGRAVLLVFCGLVFRTAAAYFATHGTDLTPKERLFIAFAWMPKATVQAALCGYPLYLINQVTLADGWKNEEEQEKYEKWGSDILATGVLAILMTAPAGLIFIQKIGPKWLEKYEPPEGGDETVAPGEVEALVAENGEAEGGEGSEEAGALVAKEEGPEEQL